MNLKIPDLKKMTVPAVAVVIGLVIGLGFGYWQLQKEQKIAQTRISEANKKLAFMQKKLADERNETVASVQQQCQADMDKLQKEKGVLTAQIGSFKAQAKTMESKSAENAELAARTKKEFQELDAKYTKAVQHNKDLDAALKKAAGDNLSLQAGLKKTNQDLGHCKTNNAELSMISQDLLKKYRNKGLGTVILQNEPLTQIKKVELEKITQQYQDEIDKLKINKQ